VYFTATPLASLAGTTTYKIRITTGAQDAAGNALAATFTTATGFTTAAGADITPPTVSSTTPANAATSIALNTTVAVTFSEAMNPATITTNTANTVCSGTFQVSSDTFTTCVQMTAAPVAGGGNSVFTVTPVANLTGGPTTYKIRITTGAQDAAGNALAAAFTTAAGFTTVSAAVYMYASSSTTTGNVGGRAGADATCTASKPGALTCTTIHAVISINNTTDEIATLASNYAIPAGRPVQGPTGIAFQTDWNTFVNSGPPSTTAAATAGILAGAGAWWSFSAASLPPTGLPAAQNCTNGTSTGGTAVGGITNQTGASFFNFGGTPACNSGRYLLCICY
jgi:hypothetical protein